MTVTVSDLKPGDAFAIGFDVIVDGNPAYVALQASNVSDSENTPNPEPEPSGGPDNSSSPDPVGGSSDLGDLDNKLFVEDFGTDSTNKNGGLNPTPGGLFGFQPSVMNRTRNGGRPFDVGFIKEAYELRIERGRNECRNRHKAGWPGGIR